MPRRTNVNLFYFVMVAASASVRSMDNLRVAFQWKQLDFAFASEDQRREAVERGHFVPENNLPLGLEVYGERLFVTVPRWKSGVAASLTYIKLTGSEIHDTIINTHIHIIYTK